MFGFFRKNQNKIVPGLYALAGSFIIAYGWGSYHFNKRPTPTFYWKIFGLWLFVLLSYLLIKRIYFILSQKYLNDFWLKEFYSALNFLFFNASLFFLIFFIKNELSSLFLAAGISLALYFSLQRVLKKHSESLIDLNKSYFALFLLLFVIEGGAQYLAYKLYIFDSNIRFFNIVLFRTLAMVIFWLSGFAFCSYIISRFRNAFGAIPLIMWGLLFSGFVVIWGVNLSILYYSGLYLSPTALQHFEGSGRVAQNNLVYILGASAIIAIGLTLYTLYNSAKIWNKSSTKNIAFYSLPIILACLGIFFGVTSFRNAPEFVIAKSFYVSYFKEIEAVNLDATVQNKLKKFGLDYDLSNFFVNAKSQVFTPTSTRYLPERLLSEKPNIVVVFLESFSSRLSDVYGSKFKNVTPNLKGFADDPNSTVFKKYFNASTPTITGSLSQLCSFLTPTGHNEIQEEKKLQSHRLLCLPEILKKEAGFKYATYITAVNKSFANKDGIFLGMGVDKVYGTDELRKYIEGEPLSWGYSDHQLFPALWGFMQSAPQPFLMMLGTVDTHPPFNLPKDAVNYEDGSRPVLNMFHSTDDAFGKFWNEFKKSKFYENTIVVAVADHAIFPGALTTDLFKEEASTLTYYDENFLVMYVPENVLPKTIEVYSSGVDLLPTILQMMNINIPNSFEGKSILDDRKNYPNILGMHELGLYINQISGKNKRAVDYMIPSEINCERDYVPSLTDKLTLCDYKNFYGWKRKMFEEGRFWKQ